MTRRKSPTPFVMVSRHDVPGEVGRAVVLVPRALRDRYRAVAEIIDTTVLAVTVTHLDTGEIVEVRGDRVTIPATGTTESVGRLWADALAIAHAATRRGRPPGSDVTEDRIRTAVAALREEGREITLNSIHTASGVFTYHQLRYYLRKHERHLSDYR